MKPIRGPDGRVWGSRRQLLTPRQEQAARQAWSRGLRRDQVASAAGITVARLVARLKDQLADLPRRGQGVGGGARGEEDDPSEEEIWGRLVLEVQARWSEEERDQRWMGRFNDSDDPE